jgi:hypothetical protein
VNYARFLLGVAAIFLTNAGFAQTARNYYDELYKAGGLDRMADGYVCFDDRLELQTFFIFGESKVLKDFLIENRGFDELKPKWKAQINRGFLNVRGYDKGVVVGEEQFFNKDRESWVTDEFFISKGTPARIRLTISWETLRYKKSVEVLSADSTLKSQFSTYGRCELVPPTVQQKGN